MVQKVEIAVISGNETTKRDEKLVKLQLISTVTALLSRVCCHKQHFEMFTLLKISTSEDGKGFDI